MTPPITQTVFNAQLHQFFVNHPAQARSLFNNMQSFNQVSRQALSTAAMLTGMFLNQHPALMLAVQAESARMNAHELAHLTAGAYGFNPYSTGYGSPYSNSMRYSMAYGSQGMGYGGMGYGGMGYGGQGQIPSHAANMTSAPAQSLLTTYPQATGVETDVVIHDDHFEPRSITVQAGTTVRWTNRGRDEHTVTCGTGLFDSRDLDSGKGFSYTFDRPGTYYYQCQHRRLEMQAVVVVK